MPGTDLRVSRVALAASRLMHGLGIVDIGAAIAGVQKACDMGINFFDTADVYGLGRSEELLARALGPRRHDVVIASKGGVCWEPPVAGARARTWRDASRGHIVRAIEATLRRLQVECLSLYYLHWPDLTTPIEETMEALRDCRRDGKVRHVAVSNFSPAQIELAHACVPLAAVQVEYSLLRRDAEVDLLPTCQRLGIGVVAYGALAQGMLTGKYGAQSRFGSDDRRRRLAQFSGSGLEAALGPLRAVEAVAAGIGRSAAQVALRWALDSPGIACVVAGAKNPTQVEENAGACGWQLSPAEHRQLAVSTSRSKVPAG